jgi:hypothetical protein
MIYGYSSIIKAIFCFFMASVLILQVQGAFEFSRIPTSCNKKNCPRGACEYTDCEETVSCLGGGCKFIRCNDAVCEGGSCVFDQSWYGKCPGGGCDFVQSPHSLRKGYCDGQSCTLNGREHPDFIEFLTI